MLVKSKFGSVKSFFPIERIASIEMGAAVAAPSIPASSGLSISNLDTLRTHPISLPSSDNLYIFSCCPTLYEAQGYPDC